MLKFILYVWYSKLGNISSVKLKEGKDKRKTEKLRICPGLKDANFASIDPHISHDLGIR